MKPRAGATVKGDGMLTVGSLFSGIGGMDLGLERAGMRVEWQVEIDDYARRVLTKHWPHVPKYGDITTIDWATVPRVDLLCGGFPCQDLSYAGKRAGLREGTRSGLWFHYLRAIRVLRPQYILVENVPGLLTNHALGRVLGDLAESGYDAEWDCLPASAVGAPHRRDRVWIVAYPAEIRSEGNHQPTGGTECAEERICSKSLRSHPTRQNTDVANPQKNGNHQRIITHPTKEQAFWVNQYGEYGRRFAITDFWKVEPTVGRVVDGVPHRLDRIGALGNAVVPQIVEALGRMILAAHCDPNMSRHCTTATGKGGDRQ